LLRQSYKRIHFIGIGGAGVSALAHLMLQEGRVDVTGSDCSASEVTEGLTRAGATIWIGHDEAHVRRGAHPADLVVYTTAVAADNPELVFAREHNIPAVTRQQFMTYCALRKDAIVISGSHGKSTTTSMLATAFIGAQADPTIVLGSLLKHNMGVKRSMGETSCARYGKSRWFLCEGDESNNSMLELKAKVAVVTNIDYDHMDFHGSLANLKNAFLRFLNGPGQSGIAVVCTDDQNVRSILPEITSRVVSYGLTGTPDYLARGYQAHPGDGISFEVHHRERGPLGVINLGYPGQHNVLNALAVIAVSLECGLPFNIVAAALETFPGVKRRYEKYYDADVAVIDDYAHHPSEIHALLSAAREVFPNRRIRALFEPHRYTRSRNLATQFPPSFALADEIVLAPIYSAHEALIPGIGPEFLNSHFAALYGPDKLKCMPLADTAQYLLETLRPGDVIMTIGAGNVNLIAARIAAALKTRADAPVEKPMGRSVAQATRLRK
jgi:UDP-N-acetylmuramate--alanine ligase